LVAGSADCGPISNLATATHTITAVYSGDADFTTSTSDPLSQVVNSLAPCTVAPFSDVPISHPFCAEISWMKDAGISTGYDDGTYRPSADVTRMAMSAFMYRVSALLP
ncbi:MAG: S-layer homology domain-containing protein, partial [Aeromicrobium sp.]